MASKALRSFGSEVTGMDMARAQSFLLEAFLGVSQTFLRVPVVMDGSPAVKAQEENR